MPFNNYFNLNRFARLFKQDLLINKTKYFLAIIGLGLITYLLTYWFLDGTKSSMIKNERMAYSIYGVCFAIYMIVVGVVVGTAFPDLSDKIKTSNYLLNPGSTLEKVMLQFLVRIGLFVPIAFAVFWIAIRLAKASLVPEALSKTVFFDPSVVPYFEYRFLIANTHQKMSDIWHVIFLIFEFFSYGIYLFAGATYFKRYALVKSVIVSIVVWLIAMSFSVTLSHIFYPQETQGFDTKFIEFAVVEQISSLDLFFLVLSLLSWMFFLAIAYFKLKEKEA